MEEKAKKVVKRWRWTRRIYFALILFVVVTIIARVWWGNYADSKLQTLLDSIAARGEPIAFADLAPPEIPDDKNAALLYKKALEVPLLAAAVVFDDSDFDREKLSIAYTSLSDSKRERLCRLGGMISELVMYPDFRSSHKADMQEILHLAKDALALCRQARSLKDSNWGIDYSGPASEIDFPPLEQGKVLAKLLSLAALSAHEGGQDDQAIEYLRDIIAMSDSIDSCPRLLCHLVALNIDYYVPGTVEEISSQLKVGNSDGAANPKKVRVLIEGILDVSKRRRGLVQAFIAERNWHYDAYERLRAIEGDSESIFGLRGYPRLIFHIAFEPMFILDELCLLRGIDALALSSKELNYSASRKKYNEMFDADKISEQYESGGFFYKISHLWSSRVMSSLNRVSGLHFRGMAFREMAGVALAIRLYEVEHNRRPGKLDDLVGKYISAIPADPFDPDSETIRYLPSDTKPILYSLNDNCKDDAGLFELHKHNSKRYKKGSVGWDSPDMPFFLNGDRPIGKSRWKEPKPGIGR